jgi:hypothetical protein
MQAEIKKNPKIWKFPHVEFGTGEAMQIKLN